MASLRIEKSKLQFANMSHRLYGWDPSPPEGGCKPSIHNAAFGSTLTGQVPNEDVECKFQNLESSLHKMGIVLDSVQNDVMRLNRAMKDATLESDSIQKKTFLLENSLLEICKGHDDVKAFVEGSTKSNLDQLNVMNFHSRDLDDISLNLSSIPKQIQSNLRLLQSDISSVLSEEMQGIVRAVISSESRPAAVQMPSYTIDESSLVNPIPEANEKLLLKQTPVVNGRTPESTTPAANRRTLFSQIPVANGKSLMNQTPVVNEKSLVNQTSIANGRSLASQTPVVIERPPANQILLADGRPLLNQKPAANGRPLMRKNLVASGQLLSVPASSICPAMVANLNLNVEEGIVRALPQNLPGSSCSLAPEHEGIYNRHVSHQLTTKKVPVFITIDSHGNSEAGVLSMTLTTETARVDSQLMKGAAEENLRKLKRGRKRKGDMKAILPAKERTAIFESTRSAAGTGSGMLKRTSDRDRRPSIRFHGPDWYG